MGSTYQQEGTEACLCPHDSWPQPAGVWGELHSLSGAALVLMRGLDSQALFKAHSCIIAFSLPQWAYETDTAVSTFGEEEIEN